MIQLVILSDAESNTSEDSPSSDHALVAPGVSPFLSDDHSESEPLEDSSKEDAPEPHEATISRWRDSEISFGRPYRTHPNGVLRMLTAGKRVYPFPACILANHKRFCYVSSSLSPLPRKRRRVSPHSSSSVLLSSSSVGPSHKRFHQETSLEDSTERGYKASIEGGIEVGAEASVGATIEIAIDIMAEPDTLPVLPERIVRMENVEEEARILTSRFETAKEERTNLYERVRALELSEQSLRDTLRVEKERFARVQHHFGFVSKELRQSKIIMPATRSGMTPEAMEEVIAQRVAEALEAYEADQNIENVFENEGDNGNGNPPPP
ncbi:hypothetical protein Tco_0847158 [Tanacetum coccineum]